MSTNKCQLCFNLGAPKSPKYLTLDDRKTHAQFHLFQLGYVGNENIALRRVFEQCFLTTEMFVNGQMEANGSNQEKNVEKSRWTLLELCLTLIKNRKDSTSLFCRVCKSNVQCALVHVTSGSSRLNSNSLLDHVIFHSVTKPYQCPYCEYGSASKHNLIRHVKETHASSTSSVEVRDAATEYWSANFDEIVATLGKCFEGFDPAATIRSDLRNQQLLRCAELLKTFANKEKELRCILCEKWIFTNGRSLYGLRHIQGHLQKPIVKCKKCSRTFTSNDGVRKHLLCRHKVSSAKDLIADISDKYHKEIMELATKCFDVKSNL